LPPSTPRTAVRDGFLLVYVAAHHMGRKLGI
jgi:hypothetical protein